MTGQIGRGTRAGMAVSKVVPVRLPEQTLARVDAHGARLRQLTGLTPSRSEVVKMLIERGLVAVEAEATQSRKR